MIIVVMLMKADNRNSLMAHIVSFDTGDGSGGADKMNLITLT